MTFPGESLTVADSGNVTGTPIASPTVVAYRAGSATFTAGDEAWVDVSLYPMLLTAGEPGVVVSWVVEVPSGSGTLTLTEDAGSLGSHTVTAGTLVVPSTLTVADIVAGGMARLTIACTAGTVEVQQVKLRAWPVGGALGGYSDPYTPPPVPVTVGARLASGEETIPDTLPYVTGSDIDVVFQDAETQLAGALGVHTVGTPAPWDITNVVGARFTAIADETYGATPPAQGWGTIGAGIVYVNRADSATLPDPAGVYGVDWIFPPNEVPYDPDGWQYTGAPVWGWYQGVATVIVDRDTGPVPGLFRVGTDPVDAIDPPATAFSDVFASANVTAAIEADPIALELEFPLPELSEAGLVRVAFWHDGATPPPFQEWTQDYPGPTGRTITTGDARANIHLGRYVAGTFQPVRASYTRPYRYWVPTIRKPAPHLIFQRSDGLGAGAALTYKRDTRQATGTVYGNY